MVHDHNKHHHNRAHLRAATQIRRMRLQPNFRRAEPMQRVQWSVFLYRDNLSWVMMMMMMMVVVEVIILKALLFKMSILCGVISAILVVILVIAITMKIRFTFFYNSLQ